MTVTRRAVLLAAVTGAAVACSGGSHPHVAPTTTTTTSTTLPGAPQPSGDLAVASRAAAVENAVAAAYGSLLGLSRLAPLPAGLKALWQTFESHHRDHALAWNAILTAGGEPVVTSNDPALSATVAPGLAAVKDIDGAIGVIAGIERTLAATYLVAVEGTLTTTGALETAAAIQPIELQHAAMLDVLTGSDPVPASFATTAGAITLS
ncbi:MAG TPA: ferritin-like domain-containing protein [Acidimicrobiales bacterium]|nr:ferritin-like domain-containing protein [Acidimicrobiales bacterium]